MTPIKIAYFGHPGSFSSKAARRFLKKNGIDQYYLFPCQSFQEVLDYVLVGECYGVLPYYNSTAGTVEEEGLINKYAGLVIDNVSLPVHHYLMGLQAIDKITKIVSHPQALLQCRGYLEKNFPAVQKVPYSTTSTAAYDLAHGLISSDCAVIASKEAAEKYQLKILASRIEDSPDNTTYFKVLFKPKNK